MLDAPTKRQGGHNIIANKAERAFAREIDAQGKTWIFQPRQFRLSPPLSSYRPDFYVIEDNTFYEVIGTRQAYSYQRLNIDAFRREYPHLRLEIVNKSGGELGVRGAYVERPKRSKNSRPSAKKSLARLLAYPDDSPFRVLGEAMKRAGLAKISETARIAGIPYDRLLYPNRRTAEEVALFLESVRA